MSSGVAGVQEFRSSGVQEFRSSGVQEFRSSGVQEFRSSFRIEDELGSQTIHSNAREKFDCSVFCNS
jgi:hypothetical protein